MNDRLFADTRLAERLEMVFTQASYNFVQAHGQLFPGQGAIAHPIGKGYAIYAGPGSPLNQGMGIGMGQAVTEDDLFELEQFFEAKGQQVNLQVSPFSHSSLIELLGRRGYRVRNFYNVHYLPLKIDTVDTVNTVNHDGIDIRAADPGDFRDQVDWAQTVGQGFAGSRPAGAMDLELAATMLQIATARCFIATIQGELAGGGAVQLLGQTAILSSASTLTGFRRRGVQRALLQARLAYAKQQGCTLAMVMTAPGNESQRNVERAGFKIAYSKMTMVR